MINSANTLNMMMRNPNVMNNPRARKVIEAYQNHDHNALVSLGNNIFQANGTTLDEATKRFISMNKIR